MKTIIAIVFSFMLVFNASAVLTRPADKPTIPSSGTEPDEFGDLWYTTLLD